MLPSHKRTLYRKGIPMLRVNRVLKSLQTSHARQGYFLVEVQTDCKTVYAVLSDGIQRIPVVNDI